MKVVVIGGVAAGMSAAARLRRLDEEAEIVVRIGLGRGTSAETVWTCDFSHDYVTINADYRS